MCGIYVRIHLNGQKVEAKNLYSLQSMSHRGRDGEDFFIHQNIGLAHKRLSIYDVTDAGRQPMHYNGLHMVYNGAVYNHIEIKQQLEGLGHNFHSHADTEVLLHAYAQWGSQCFEKFDGQWAVIIYDERSEKVIVCRDRFGIKPLYKYHKNGILAYASEIKALCTDASINIQDIMLFLKDGRTDTADRSFYHEISAVNPATIVSLDLNTKKFEEQIYYTVEHSKENYHLSFQDAAHQFSDLFKQSISLSLRADVPTGISLSGGMDSNSIANTTKLLHADQQKSCFIVDFDGESNSEINFADATIQSTGYKLFEVKPTLQKMLNALPQAAYFQDLPFSSMSVLAQYLLFERVAQTEVKVILSGQGADEILGGYDAFILAYYHHLKQHSSFAAMKYLAQNAISQPRLFLDKLFHRQKNKNSAEDHFADIYDFQRKSINKSPMPALLRFEDRNAMAHGIESRLPFLDHRIVDFCLSLPIHYIMQAGCRKPLLVEAMKDILPQEILRRKDKTAYFTPQARWMHTDKKLFGDMTQQAVSNIKSIGIDCKIENDNALDWRIISTGMWLEVFKK